MISICMKERIITMSNELWSQIGSAAREMSISRSAFVRIASMEMLKEISKRNMAPAEQAGTKSGTTGKNGQSGSHD